VSSSSKAKPIAIPFVFERRAKRRWKFGVMALAPVATVRALGNSNADHTKRGGLPLALDHLFLLWKSMQLSSNIKPMSRLLGSFDRK
jgi:hypothetical protein